jgi:formylglycine-generating enzyme required for sulfatase activity
MSKRENKTCHLPTEEQWEFAARNGVESTTFPWGNDWRDNAAVLSTRIVPVGTSGDQTKVGGIEDMLGNVSEWTTSRLALYKGHNGNRSADNKYISVRGLNWYTPANLLKKPELLLTYRNPTAEDEKNQYLGFRLVCEP